MADVTMWTGRIDFPADYAALKKLSAGRTEVARPGDGARRQVVSHWVFQISRIFVFSQCIQCELWAAAATEKKLETRGIGFLYFSPWTNIISI